MMVDEIATAPVRRSASLPLRWVRLVGGLWVFAAGLALMVRADLGLSPWDVLHDAVRVLTPLTFGEVVVAVSVLVVAASMLLGVRPGAGTIANSVLVGVFTDVLLRSGFLEGLRTDDLALRVPILLVGIAGIAAGSALYIGANLGAGPRDGLMLGIGKRSGLSVGAARTGIEATVLLLGVALGGSVGLGTALFVVLIGPEINWAFRLFGMETR
jgi:uncharacterized membrane protein YczE